MRILKKARFTSLLLVVTLVAVMAVPAASVAASEPTVNLGTTASYAVLAGSTITNTGPTVITGDIGLSPGSAITGEDEITRNGARHVADAAAVLAKSDLTAAFDDASSRALTTTLDGVELGGRILGPGVYETGGVLEITGTLTLDAGGDPDAVFIFRSTATLITAVQSRVELINEARFCRVFWVVPSSATLGAGSVFVGHIFAGETITANRGAEVEGQLLAMESAVNLNANVITNEICAAAREIHIEKSASPTALPSGPGAVTYTYEVTNPGTVALSNIEVVDDKVASLTYVSGDNGNALLEPGETWIYTGTDDLTVTTTNTATVTGENGELTSTDTAVVTVVVARRTTTGGEIPKTGTPWYNLLLAGAVLIILGAVGWRTRKAHD
jgi:LPXTG-motif cell wall-anchored protein/uncharacterized repeat protein (TIGR01451 family)